MVIDELVAEDAEPGGDTAWAGGETWQGHACVRAHVSTVSKCVLRVGAAEDEEGASLGDGGDLLLLHQVGDDGPRPRRNLRVVLLPGRVVLLVLLANRAARVRTQGCANCRAKAAVGMLQDTFSSFSSSFLSLQERVKIKRTSEHLKLLK